MERVEGVGREEEERGEGEKGRERGGKGMRREGGEGVGEEKYHLAGMVSSLNAGCQEETIWASVTAFRKHCHTSPRKVCVCGFI